MAVIVSSLALCIPFSVGLWCLVWIPLAPVPPAEIAGGCAGSLRPVLDGPARLGQPGLSVLLGSPFLDESSLPRKGNRAISLGLLCAMHISKGAVSRVC